MRRCFQGFNKRKDKRKKKKGKPLFSSELTEGWFPVVPCLLPCHSWHQPPSTCHLPSFQPSPSSLSFVHPSWGLMGWGTAIQNTSPSHHVLLSGVIICLDSTVILFCNRRLEILPPSPFQREAAISSNNRISDARRKLYLLKLP